LSDQKKIWREARKKNGVEFAESGLELTLNVAAEMKCREKDLAETIRKMETGSSPCVHGDNELRSIHYAAFQRATLVFSITDFAKSPPPAAANVVIFGGAYGDDDLHITPIGQHFGVEIHAARYASLTDTPLAHRHVVAFWADVAFAALFSMIVKTGVDAYAGTAKSTQPWTRQRRGGVMTLFVVLYVAACGVALWVAWFLLPLGIVVEPLLIALGMMIDGFVVGPWRALSHRLDEPHLSMTDAWRTGLAQDRWGASWFLTFRVLFWLVCIAALLWVHAGGH
jgi:hypothetical protein